MVSVAPHGPRPHLERVIETRRRGAGANVNRLLQSSLLAFWAVHLAQASAQGLVQRAGEGSLGDAAAMVRMICAGLFALALLLFVLGRSEERQEAKRLVEAAVVGIIVLGGCAMVLPGLAVDASWLYRDLPALLLTLGFIVFGCARDETETMQLEVPAGSRSSNEAFRAAFDVALEGLSGRRQCR